MVNHLLLRGNCPVSFHLLQASRIVTKSQTVIGYHQPDFMGQHPGHACKLDGAIGQFTQSFDPGRVLFHTKIC